MVDSPTAARSLDVGTVGVGRHVATLIAALLFLPVFVDSSGLFNSTRLDARGYPVSLLLIGLFPIAVFACRSAAALTALAAVAACILIPTTIVVVLLPQDFSLTLTMSYVSSLLVGFGVYSLTRRLSSSAGPEQVLMVGVYAISMVLVFWLPFQVGNVMTEGRANGSVLDVFVIYQVWVYWPTTMAIAFCASFISPDPKVWVLRLLLFVGIFFTGAREPFLMIAVFGVLLAIGSGKARHYVAIAIAGLLFLLAVVLFMTIYPDALISLKLSAMLTGETSLDGGRLGVLDQFNLGEVNSVWGTGFSSAGVFGSPHNQFIEFYYRGGIFGVLIAVMMVYTWIRSYLICSTIVWSTFGALLAVSYLLNTPVRVPYTGAIIWTLFFFLVESLSDWTGTPSSAREWHSGRKPFTSR